MNKLFNFLPLLALRAVVVLGFVLGVVVRDSEVMVLTEAEVLNRGAIAPLKSHNSIRCNGPLLIFLSSSVFVVVHKNLSGLRSRSGHPGAISGRVSTNQVILLTPQR